MCEQHDYHSGHHAVPARHTTILSRIFLFPNTCHVFYIFVFALLFASLFSLFSSPLSLRINPAVYRKRVDAARVGWVVGSGTFVCRLRRRVGQARMAPSRHGAPRLPLWLSHMHPLTPPIPLALLSSLCFLLSLWPLSLCFSVKMHPTDVRCRIFCSLSSYLCAFVFICFLFRVGLCSAFSPPC